jgi:hypothetical protein
LYVDSWVEQPSSAQTRPRRNLGIRWTSRELGPSRAAPQAFVLWVTVVGLIIRPHFGEHPAVVDPSTERDQAEINDVATTDAEA